MTQDELTRKEADLFDRWEKAHKEHGVGLGFTKDGIVDFDRYWQTHPRLLYLLKEANWHDEDPVDYENSDEREGLRLGGYNPPCDTAEGKEPRKWRNFQVIARWTYQLTADAAVRWEDIDDEANSEDFRRQQLQKIAFVNLKKVGGSSVCNADKLASYAELFGKFVREQIGLYRPDIIICNGTAELVEKYVFSQEEREPSRRASNTIWWFKIKPWPCAVVDMYHFGARMNAKTLHYYLVNACKEFAPDIPLSLRG